MLEKLNWDTDFFGYEVGKALQMKVLTFIFFFKKQKIIV